MKQDETMPMPAGTVLESDEQIQKVIADLKRRSAQSVTPPKDHTQRSTTVPVRVEMPFKPTVRPPMAILTVCDDGETTGELIRIRSDRFIIGRTEGDFQLPNDEQVSSRHVALIRQVVANHVRWVITDLQSRNGMFVRVSKAPMAHMAEVLVGSGRYQFEIAQAAGAETPTVAIHGVHGPTTRGFDNHLPVGTVTLTEILNGGLGPRIVLTRDQYWFGSHPDCEICRMSDPYVREKHANLSRSEKGTWMIQNQQAANGVWLKMSQITIEAGKKCDFQIGEQRFKLAFGA